MMIELEYPVYISTKKEMNFMAVKCRSGTLERILKEETPPVFWPAVAVYTDLPSFSLRLTTETDKIRIHTITS